MVNLHVKISAFIIISAVLIFNISQVYGLTPRGKKKIEQLIEDNKLAEAQKVVQKLLQEDPLDAGLHYELGEVYQALGETDMALQEFQTALSIDYFYYDAYYEVWKYQWDNTKDDSEKNKLKSEIEEKLSSMLQLKTPTDKLYALAFFTYDMLKNKERRDEMRKMLLKEYPRSELIENVGQQAFENILGESDPSKRVILAEQYINDFPTHSMTETAYRIVLRYYWKDSPDKDKIKEYTNRWIRQNPIFPIALRVSARILSEMNMEIDNAIKWAQDCVKLVRKDNAQKPSWYYEWQCPNDVRLFEAFDTLGWAYFKKGDYSNADKYLCEALTYFNFDNRIWFHLGKLYEKQSKPMMDILRIYVQALICRDDIPEIADSIKNLYKGNYPEISDETLNALYKNLYQTFADSDELPFFTDITAEAGLDKAFGRRVAWGDYNNDGYQDILLDGCRLWRNNGNGTFTEVTKESNITGAYGGGIWADYNNDGYLDFFSAGGSDALWRNNGNGTFTNLTSEINPKLSDGYPTEGAGWGDYNHDGFIDLYVANYEQPFAVGTPDFLWKNIQGKVFKDVTAEAKITPPKNRCGRGVSWADYNNDGLLDIFISNYRLNPNFLWENNGDGTFTNVAKEIGVEGFPVKGYYGHTIGSDWGDYDNDGNLDLFQANLAHPRYITFSNMSLLLKNSGAPDYTFSDNRKECGISFEETHSDPAWVDFDNDGVLDLYITSVYPERPSFLYKQEKNGRFRDVTWLTGTRVYNGWGCAWADIDNDGDLDLLVCGNSRGDNKGTIYLFRNETISTKNKPVNRNFLGVKLIGRDCNHSAIGARLILITDKNNFIREVKGGRGTTNQDSLVQHFGLGKFNKEATLIINWPCGRRQQIKVNPNQIITINETN